MAAMLTSMNVRNQVFKLTVFKQGYKIDAVDSLLDGIADSLQAWESHRPEDVETSSTAIAMSQLPTARFRETYNMAQVDAFLKEAQETLAFYERNGLH